MASKSIRLTDKNICIFFMTLLVFLDMEPFFVWGSVSQVGYRIYTIVILLATLLMAYVVCFRKQVVMGFRAELTEERRVPMPLFLAATTIIVLFFYEVFCSGVVTVTQQPFNMAMFCIHIGLMMFVLQDNMTLRSVYRYSKRIFAITLIPSIIVFLLMQVGVIFPSVTLAADAGKDLTGQSYELYLGFATMLHNQGVLLNRLCGIYREPGFVGTLGALFLLGDRMSLRKWENVIILIACICTFSLAFVVMLLLGLLLRAAGNMKRRGNAIASVVLILATVIGYFVFMSLPLNPQTAAGELQARMVITEDGLAGDNRFGSSEWAEDAYDAFLRAPISVRLFGYGKDPRTVPGTEVSIWQTVCSYKEFVFGFGFVGFVLMIAALVLCVFAKYRGVSGGRRWKIFVLVAVFLASIYQRYDVINFHYFCVLFGGAANLALMRETVEETEKHEQGNSPKRRIKVRW